MENNKDQKSEFDFDASEFPELFNGSNSGQKTEEVKTETPEVKEEKPVVEQKTTPTSNDEPNSLTITTPPGEATRMVLTRLGIICSNLSIIFVVLSFLAIVGVFLSVFYYMFLICIVVLTLFTILADPNFRGLFGGNGGFVEFITKLATISPAFMGLSAVFSIASIILLSTDKHHRHTGRIVFSGISIGIVAILALVFVFSIMGKGGTN